MKVYGLSFLFFVVGAAAFMYLGYSSNESNTFIPVKFKYGTAFSVGENTLILTTKSRKLKGIRQTQRPNKSDSGEVRLEDYRPIDPAPSTKASIRPGPIQHGTPIMPFIPQPAPPPCSANLGGHR